MEVKPAKGCTKENVALLEEIAGTLSGPDVLDIAMYIRVPSKDVSGSHTIKFTVDDLDTARFSQLVGAAVELLQLEGRTKYIADFCETISSGDEALKFQLSQAVKSTLDMHQLSKSYGMSALEESSIDE